MRCQSIIVALMLVLSTMALGGSVYADEPAKEAETAKEIKDKDYELFKLFVDSFEQIDRNYVKEVDRRELMEAAIQGMLRKLDPYSNYISPENLRAFSDSVEQQFGGIGIQVTIDPATHRLTVAAPLPGAPAQKAGVRPGDIITDIESESTKDFDIEDAVKLLRGQPGEPVKIKVLHRGESEPVEVTIVRDIIRVATVRGLSYKEDGSWSYFVDEEHKIAYLHLTTFSRNSYDELKEAMETLSEAGIKGLILDLRFNPGGLLSVATEISDMFVEEGKIVSTKGRNTQEQVFSAKKHGTYSDFPMVILVNRYSASASEIVSACLQDHKRALIIGERTWGKGSVQNVINLDYDDSALKLTTASYHRPSGKNIHRFPGAKDEDEWGVMPDEDYMIRLRDREIGNLHSHLAERELFKPLDDEEKNEDKEPKEPFADRQLEAAVAYLAAKIDGVVPPKPTTPAKEDGDNDEVAKKDDAKVPDTEEEPKPEPEPEAKPE